MSLCVVKRDGRREPYMIEKQKTVIAWACNGLDADPLQLENALGEFINDGITTVTIQESLIHHARTLASYNAPDWTVVAGRLYTMNIWAETTCYNQPLVQYIKKQVEAKRYSAEIFKFYTNKEIESFQKLLHRETDLEHSYGSVLTAHKKYLYENECIQVMHLVNAMWIASPEKQEERHSRVTQWYEELSQRKLSLATPWLISLRNGGNISSCFIIEPDDDIDSIFRAVHTSARISKNGGGLGINLARIRAKGSKVRGNENASGGVLGWCKIFNDTAVAVNQQGKRAGAFTLHVPVWHGDIEDFLEINSENGDPRKKSFDIFPQVSLSDLFMETKNEPGGGTWYTFCPYEVEQVLGIKLWNVYGKEFADAYKKCVKAADSGKLKVTTKYNAKTLHIHIMKAAFATGLPYIAFTDAINERNPNKHDRLFELTTDVGNTHTYLLYDEVKIADGAIRDISSVVVGDMLAVDVLGSSQQNFETITKIEVMNLNIPCVNLCTESFSNVYADVLAHTCNLASIVVGRVDSEEELVKLARSVTRILDNGIALTQPPVEMSAKHNNRYRTIGVGVQGLHDILAKNFKTYYDVDYIQRLAELIEYGCVMESIELAKERGAYPAFKGSTWATGEQINYIAERSVCPDIDWYGVQALIDQYGIRNSQLTSPAPNTSTSIFMDAAAGISPVYDAFFVEDNKTGKFPVAAMHLKTNPLGYSKTFSQWDQPDLAKVTGALQKPFDTGISAEYLFDQNRADFHPRQLADTIETAWKVRSKAIYYIRSIKKGDKASKAEEACESCAS
jgi:ribonucleoside-diphosphate reductase alpha chain